MHALEDPQYPKPGAQRPSALFQREQVGRLQSALGTDGGEWLEAVQ